jgi:hypothetical protein
VAGPPTRARDVRRTTGIRRPRPIGRRRSSLLTRPAAPDGQIQRMITTSAPVMSLVFTPTARSARWGG